MKNINEDLYWEKKREEMEKDEEVATCDCCGEEIPKIKKKDVFGIEREYYRFGKLNYGKPFTDINCHNLGIDLCERCAGNISLEMYKMRMELLNK